MSESKLDKATQLFVGAREVIKRSQQGCDKPAKRDPTDDGPGISEDASGCPHDSLVTFVVATCDHGIRGAGRVGDSRSYGPKGSSDVSGIDPFASTVVISRS